MKYGFKMFVMALLLSLLFSFTVSAKSYTTSVSRGNGERFGNVDYVYYRVKIKKDYGLLYVGGIYDFGAKHICNEFIKNGKEWWERRLEYSLCNSKKKVIDPIKQHTAIKQNYSYKYFLKKGTYYIRIKTDRKESEYYYIDCKLIQRNAANAIIKETSKSIKVSHYYCVPWASSKKDTGLSITCKRKISKIVVKVWIYQIYGDWDLVLKGPNLQTKEELKSKATYTSADLIYGIQVYKDNGEEIEKGHTFEIKTPNGSLPSGNYQFIIRKRNNNANMAKRSYFGRIDVEFIM